MGESRQHGHAATGPLSIVRVIANGTPTSGEGLSTGAVRIVELGGSPSTPP